MASKKWYFYHQPQEFLPPLIPLKGYSLYCWFLIALAAIPKRKTFMLPVDNTIKLMIADDHPAIRRGLKDFFSNRTGVDVVGVAANGKEVLKLMEDNCPHVTMLDIKMPVMDGRETCKTIRQRYPEVGVIAYSMFDDEEAIIDMRKAGAKGYLLKNSNEDEIYKAIRAVYEQGEYYCSAVTQRVNSLFEKGTLGRAVNEKKREYTEIELKIIKLVSQEYSSKEIASHLNIKPRAVEHYKEHIQEKMGVKGSIGIAVYATNNWLLY